MAAYNESEYLLGDELDSYLEEAFFDEEEDNEEEEDEEEYTDPDEAETRECVCGNPASENRAKCRMIHFTCEDYDNDTQCTSDDDSDESSEAIDTVCRCCQMILDATSLAETATDTNNPNKNSAHVHSSDQPSASGTGTEAQTRTRQGKKRKASTPSSTATTAAAPKQTRARRPGPKTRPQQLYTEEHALDDSQIEVVKVLEAVPTDDFFKDDFYSHAKPIRSLASNMLKREGDLKTFATNLGRKLWHILTSNKGKIGSQADTVICKELKKAQLDDNLWTEWSNLADACMTTVAIGNNGKRLLYLHVLRKVFVILQRVRNDTDLPLTPSTSPNEPLGEHDEQVLRYAAGYIPFALLKAYKKQRNAKAKVYAAFLASWKVPSDSVTEECGTFLAYTRKWVDRINRGGIFLFNDDVYMFFRSMEFECRKHVRKQMLLQPNIEAMLLEKLELNPYVQRCWDGLTKDKLSSQSSAALLAVVKKRWLKMRVTAYVSVYFIIRRLKNPKLSKKADKGVRKSVDKPTG